MNMSDLDYINRAYNRMLLGLRVRYGTPDLNTNDDKLLYSLWDGQIVLALGSADYIRSRYLNACKAMDG